MESKDQSDRPQELKRIKRRPRINGNSGCNCGSKNTVTSNQKTEDINSKRTVNPSRYKSGTELENSEQNPKNSLNTNYPDPKILSESRNKPSGFARLKEGIIKFFKL